MRSAMSCGVAVSVALDPTTGTRHGLSIALVATGCIELPESAHAKPRPLAFWAVAYAYLVTMLGTTMPTPLYGLYEAQFGFSHGVGTVVFAVYAAGVGVSLVLFGALSDRAGRRPVLAAAIAPPQSL